MTRTSPSSTEPARVPFLVATNRGQVSTIVSPGFARRCDRELGYRPMRLGPRPSPADVEAWPLMGAVEGDPVSPLNR